MGNSNRRPSAGSAGVGNRNPRSQRGQGNSSGETKRLHDTEAEFYRQLNAKKRSLAPTETVDDTSGEECPICFQSFDALNTSTCCKQRLCTECFMLVGTTLPDDVVRTHIRELVCPFCNQDGFDAVYAHDSTDETGNVVLDDNSYQDMMLSDTAKNLSIQSSDIGGETVRGTHSPPKAGTSKSLPVTPVCSKEDRHEIERKIASQRGGMVDSDVYHTRRASLPPRYVMSAGGLGFEYDSTGLSGASLSARLSRSHRARAAINAISHSSSAIGMSPALRERSRRRFSELMRGREGGGTYHSGAQVMLDDPSASRHQSGNLCAGRKRRGDR